ncbi:MAG: DNA translocase FtsK [Armatimonadota bacterium]
MPRRPRHPQVVADICGVAIVAVGALGAIAMLGYGGAGLLGDGVSRALRWMFGVGAWAFPPLMVAVGILLIAGRMAAPPADLALGACLAYGSVLGLVQWAGDLRGWTWGSSSLGGAVGQAFSSGASTLGGRLGEPVVLAAVGTAGVLVAANVPLAPLMRGMWRRLSALFAPLSKVRVPVRRSMTVKAERPTSSPKPVSKSTAIVPRKTIRRVRDWAEAADRGLEVEPEEPDAPVLTSVGHPVAVETSVGRYEMPSVALLPKGGPVKELSQDEREENVRILEATLSNFRIDAKVVEICHGPTVTRYEIQLAPGIRVKKIESLADNIAMDLAAIYVRVEAPIPGKCAIGVEVPNRAPATVMLRDVIDRPEFLNAPSKLTIPLGLDVAGNPVYADLAKMPHLLIGGATNSGKSVCLNSIISGLLFRATPDEVKLLLIDPKKVELSLYDGIPHLVYPVVKDVKQAAGVLRWAEKEMHRRYDLLVETGARNIDGYNKRADPEGEHRPLPYIVIVIDELADLMLRQGAEVETSITSLAQLARAVGIHLVIATQRPSVDVITGTIKANISSRIAFAVASHTDSRTILDRGGAERLVGRGDMLFLPIDAAKPMRVQGAYIGEEEVEALVDHLKKQGRPDYIAEVVRVDSSAMRASQETDDELFEQAVRLVVNTGHASTSMLQRKFKIGYTRAARLVDMMEEQGIVGPMDNARPREILLKKEDLNEYFRTRSEKVLEDN